MIWKKITIETSVEAADIVASVLFDNNIVGAEIEDNQNLSIEELAKMYVDIPKINVDDGKSKVCFYISIGNKDIKEDKSVDKNLVDNSYIPSDDNIFTKEEFDIILDNIKEELEDYRNFVNMGSLNISEISLDDKDFLNKWKENFKSLVIDDITILPSWEKKAGDGLNIYIEPGNAFGTGQHSTTKLCVKSLKKIMSREKTNTVLDIGCGSGILSIIAKKLGAEKVFAIDVDENVELNLLENLELNKIDNVVKFDAMNAKSETSAGRNIEVVSDIENIKYSDVFLYSFGNILSDDNFKNEFCKCKYDIIIANILSPVIILLIEKCRIGDMLSANGHLILSGIIKEKEDEVLQVIKNNVAYKNIKVDYDEEWVSFTVDI